MAKKSPIFFLYAGPYPPPWRMLSSQHIRQTGNLMPYWEGRITQWFLPIECGHHHRSKKAADACSALWARRLTRADRKEIDEARKNEVMIQEQI